MKEITLRTSDNSYKHLKYIIENTPDTKIIKDINKPLDDEFRINEDKCLKTLDKIQKGDTKGFKEVEPKELFKELGFNV